MTQPFDVTARPVVPPRTIPKHSFGQRVRIEALLQLAEFLDQTVTVCGWSKTIRKQGSGIVFIALTDGSYPATLQVVISPGTLDEEVQAALLKCGVSCSFRITGRVVKSPAKGQTYELQVDDKEKHSLKIYGMCDQQTFPLAKKAHSKEFLREIQHLRPRSYLIGAVTRIRTALAGATHQFFQSRGFQYVTTPIITCSDCEGAGELFQISTLLPEDGDISKIPVDPKTQKVLFGKDFFNKKAYLTVSGQLNAEAYSCALSDVYTFGPAFRAEESHTSRHLAEFWMIEPEMAFADLHDNMDCAESFIRYCVQVALDHHRADLDWLETNVEKGLIDRLENIASCEFARISYSDAIERLLEEGPDRFEVQVQWGMDLNSEHERFLAEAFKRPTIVFNYPKDIKPFYMKRNEDGKTVRAMDILVPKIGEVVGGSQREEQLDVLDKQIDEKKLDKESLWWYRELRKYGSVPHSGFGVGFERLIMMITGVENIRDVIPFPRAAGSADF